jgi:nucleoredoxin
MLANFYREVNANGKQLEIIFATSGNTEPDFYSYFDEMPWVAIPFGDPKLETTCARWAAEGIPHLVILDKDGNSVVNGAKDLV